MTDSKKSVRLESASRPFALFDECVHAAPRGAKLPGFNQGPALIVMVIEIDKVETYATQRLMLPVSLAICSAYCR